MENIQIGCHYICALFDIKNYFAYGLEITPGLAPLTSSAVAEGQPYKPRSENCRKRPVIRLKGNNTTLIIS